MGLKRTLTKTNIDFAFRKTVNITPEFLKKNGIQGLILDVDNTLTTDENLIPAEGIPEWIEKMKKNGIKLVIVSNNHPQRVKPLANALGVKCVCDSGKPLKRGYDKAMEIMGLYKTRVGAVGDQIFTDIWGANFSGVKSIYVEPMALEGKEKRFIRFKRKLEVPFVPKHYIDDKKGDKK